MAGPTVGSVAYLPEDREGTQEAGGVRSHGGGAVEGRTDSGAGLLLDVVTSPLSGCT